LKSVMKVPLPIQRSQGPSAPVGVELPPELSGIRIPVRLGREKTHERRRELYRALLFGASFLRSPPGSELGLRLAWTGRHHRQTWV
jgi:hypothetical protein